MQAAELHTLADIHPPIQVEYDLEYGREDSRSADSSDGKVQCPVRVFDDNGGRR